MIGAESQDVTGPNPSGEDDTSDKTLIISKSQYIASDVDRKSFEVRVVSFHFENLMAHFRASPLAERRKIPIPRS